MNLDDLESFPCVDHGKISTESGHIASDKVFWCILLECERPHVGYCRMCKDFFSIGADEPVSSEKSEAVFLGESKEIPEIGRIPFHKLFILVDVARNKSHALDNISLIDICREKIKEVRTLFNHFFGRFSEDKPFLIRDHVKDLALHLRDRVARLLIDPRSDEILHPRVRIGVAGRSDIWSYSAGRTIAREDI